MKSQLFIKKTIVVAVLIAVGVLIPMFSPVKFVLEPASFTLAVHVPIFIAMCISPAAALAVVAGTSLGFFLGGFPQVIVLRAVSHILFALAGSVYLQYNPRIFSSFLKSQLFSIIISLIHAGIELAVVSFVYLNGDVNGTYYSTSALLLLIGLGSFVHSMVDFNIAFLVMKLLMRQKTLRPVFITSELSQKERG